MAWFYIYVYSSNRFPQNTSNGSSSNLAISRVSEVIYIISLPDDRNPGGVSVTLNGFGKKQCYLYPKLGKYIARYSDKPAS